MEKALRGGDLVSTIHRHNAGANDKQLALAA
jgi:hypothetical protein